MKDKPISHNPNDNRPRLGRPPIPREQARANRVVTFVTEVELAKLQEIAAQRRESVSAAVHRVLSRFLGTQTE